MRRPITQSTSFESLSKFQNQMINNSTILRSTVGLLAVSSNRPNPSSLRSLNEKHIGVGDGRGHVPPKIREKYFSGNYYVKFRHKTCKIREFC